MSLNPVRALRTFLPGCLALAALTLLPASRADAQLFVSSFLSNQVLQYDATTGAFLGVFASGGGLSQPDDLTFGPDGNLYVVSRATNQVLRYDGTTGAFQGVFASGGGLIAPTGLRFGPDGNLYVSSAETDQVLRYDGTTGAFLGVFASGGGLDTPFYLRFGPNGNLYVVSDANSQVLIFDGTTGAFVSLFAATGSAPIGLTFDGSGNLFAASYSAGIVQKFDPAGNPVPGFSSSVLTPYDTELGPDGNLYVSSSTGNSVVRVDPITGATLGTFVAPGNGLNTPTGLVFRASRVFAAAPEPGTLALLGIGSVGASVVVKRRRNRQ